MTENQIATIIVDSSFKIHQSLGPGLLETVYEAALAYELTNAGCWSPYNEESLRPTKTLGLTVDSGQTSSLKIK